MNKKNLLNIFFKGVEFVIVLVGLYLMYEGYFKIRWIFNAMLILLLMLIYKYITHKVGISRGYVRLDLTYIIGQISEESKNREKFERFVYKFFNKSIFKTNLWLYDVVFWVMRLNPFNFIVFGMSFFYKMLHDLIVLINVNKDVFFKKYFNVDSTRWNLSIYDKWYYKIYLWLVWYPFLRLLLFPRRIRERILEKETFGSLVKLRVIIYFYSILLLYFGYYEFVGQFSVLTKIFVVYLYLVLIWPILLRLRNRIIDYNYLYPSNESFSLYVLRNNSVSLCTYLIYIQFICYNVTNSYSLRYNSYDPGVQSSVWEFKNRNYSLNSKKFTLINRWLYEKGHLCSYVAYESLMWNNCCLLFDEALFAYNLGLRILGDSVVKKYDDQLKQAIEVYKCGQFLMMDIRRFLGYPKELWLQKPFEYIEYGSCKNLINLMKKAFDDGFYYKNLPNNFISLSLYNKLLYNISLYKSNFFRYNLTRFIGVKGEPCLFDEMEMVVFNDPFVKYEILDDWHYNVFIYEYDKREEFGIKYEPAIDVINEKIEEEYMRVLSKLTNSNNLVSSIEIKKYLKKYFFRS